MTDKQLIEELEAEESMFVQTTEGIASDGRTLTLNGVTPSTLYFSDRPKRVVGHMATADFVELVGKYVQGATAAGAVDVDVVSVTACPSFSS